MTQEFLVPDKVFEKEESCNISELSAQLLAMPQVE